ncbi:MAG: hypothetical protein ACKOAH_05700, partial [Pirellula sp.]
MSNIFDQFVEDSQADQPPDEQSESQLVAKLASESGSTGMATATPRELKIAVQELLKQGFIEES